jgi:2-polyprenyl-3-methyl-5-hydroxy-6-metoxy-1,4-benzoquinol methylase
MPRLWNAGRFDAAYSEFICKGVFNEAPDYYPRYRSRYKKLIQTYCLLAPDPPATVLDVGGGQLATLCKALWNDHACVADIDESYFDHRHASGLKTAKWNLCADEQPFGKIFDVIFFSEVIEHLPVPGHMVLERLKASLKPGGAIICSTPNLYRLRNIVFMIFGIRIFDYFQMPDAHGLGHVIEYSRDHLLWQFQQAGLINCAVSYYQTPHMPKKWLFKLVYAMGYPLLLIPRFRDTLLAVARAPQASDE